MATEEGPGEKGEERGYGDFPLPGVVTRTRASF